MALSLLLLLLLFLVFWLMRIFMLKLKVKRFAGVHVRFDFRCNRGVLYETPPGESKSPKHGILY